MIATALIALAGGCASALMFASIASGALISLLLLYLAPLPLMVIALGWGPYQNDHEDANGQFEMNWEFDDALVTADRHAFFKFMVKSIAEKNGLRATFMPKPFANLTGNGCHAHVSLWSKGKNVFDDPKGELGLSPLAYNFIGGLMHNGPALTAITNPTVNSYKRINAPPTLSGATWSPNTTAATGCSTGNRTTSATTPPTPCLPRSRSASLPRRW